MSKGKDRAVLVEIISFCLMPNHFHLLLKQVADNGISIYLSKVTNSYTKYFNTKYNRVGPLYQGSFKSVRMESQEQVIHVSRYIHLNPVIGYLVQDLESYPYSSYSEYLNQSTGFCEIADIMESFPTPEQYQEFVLNQVDYAKSLKSMERLLLEDVQEPGVASVHLPGVRMTQGA